MHYKKFSAQTRETVSQFGVVSSIASVFHKGSLMWIYFVCVLVLNIYL